MTNPFIPPMRSLGDRRPLNPRECEEHTALYVDVDHTAQAFAAGVDAMSAALQGARELRMLLAVGEEGTGKTALLHRWATWMRGRCSDAGLRHDVIDLSGEAISALGSGEQWSHVVGRLIDRLGLLGALSAEEVSRIEARSEGTSRFPAVADALEAQQWTISVILPPIETLPQLRLFAESCRAGIYLLAETAEIRRQSVAESTFGSAGFVAWFELGGLGVEDGWQFVASRVEAGAHVPVVDRQAIEQFMSARIAGRGSATIRELQRTLEHVYEHAMHANQAEITYEDFKDYYTRMAATP